MNDPTRALQALLQADGLSTNAVSAQQPLSRDRDRARRTVPMAASIVYLRRRFVPPPEAFSVLQEHTVVQGERLDTICRHAISGDPEQFWRLCDANGAMRPEELIEAPGTKVTITLPDGVAGCVACLKGSTLQLYVGPLVPIPAPRLVMDALTEVSVTVNDVGQSGFQLSFTIGTQVAAAYAVPADRRHRRSTCCAWSSSSP